jgi:hypothetical protein
MTDTVNAAYEAATLLAKIENETNVELLAKITSFVSDLESMLTGLNFPPTYTSASRGAVTEIISSLSYRRDTDLPSRIRTYDQQMAPPVEMPAYTPAQMTPSSPSQG